ncbi:cytochrome P450 [Plenodomus tracheiphilus IPT5]|uniref:Cytochrome P450 n=1 Tax=Plenodomus tracheiphilus IPT5 TaxID=1408161 RepID=A0A6A7B1X3_9PLEO|nr:cytochrome P450 [Plenodomus tracheiphilus IPT5]
MSSSTDIDVVSSWYNSKLGLIFLVLLWCGWRFWTFTLSPRLNPTRPKTLTYSVPWVGHIASFVRNGNGLITKGRLHFQNTREPFALVLGGQYVYVITSAKDTTAIFRNTSQITFDAYVEDMQLRFGASPGAVKAIWAKPQEFFLRDRLQNGGFPNPHGKALAHVSEAIFKAQLYPGEKLNALSTNFLKIIIERADWKSISESVILERNRDDTERLVSLHRWTRDVLLYAATRAFFGEALFKLDPNVLDYFATFDEDSWQFTYQVPERFARKTYQAKAITQHVFDRYFDLPARERSDANWMILTLESEMRAIGIESRDISAYLLMIYWVINGNAWKAAYWLCSFILFNPELKASLEKDLRPLFRDDTVPEPAALMKQMEDFPQLTAAYNETLRICTSSVTVRNVLEDCVVGTSHFQKGSRVLIPFLQMMMDEAVFGDKPEEFRHERFLEKPARAKDPSFRPFGGGLTYCPGRFMAQHEIFMVVALLFGKLGVSLPEGVQAFPKMETKKPCLGMMGPAKGHDLHVNVCKNC